MADLCLWNPAFFGVKPDLILKSGFIVGSLMGDPNASIPTPEPVRYRPMFGAYGRALDSLCVHFVSRASLSGGLPALSRRALPVFNTRSIGKKDLILNDATPNVEVDAETYRVTVDGELITSQAAETLPLTQRYFLF